MQDRNQLKAEPEDHTGNLEDHPAPSCPRPTNSPTSAELPPEHEGRGEQKEKVKEREKAKEKNAGWAHGDALTSLVPSAPSGHGGRRAVAASLPHQRAGGVRAERPGGEQAPAGEGRETDPILLMY